MYILHYSENTWKFQKCSHGTTDQRRKELAEQGVKELILVAQETTLYGKDLYGEKCLHRLVEELCKIAGIRWIRILYCYPEEITDELIEVIKKNRKCVIILIFRSNMQATVF